MNVKITVSKEEIEEILTEHFKSRINGLEKIIIEKTFVSGGLDEIIVVAILEKKE